MLERPIAIMMQSTSVRALLQVTLRASAPATVFSSRGYLKHAGQPGVGRATSKQVPRPAIPARARKNSTLPNQLENPATSHTVLDNRIMNHMNVISTPKLKSSDPYCNDHLPSLNLTQFRNSTSNALSMYTYQREIKTKKLFKNIHLLTPVREEGTYSHVHRKTNREHRPLVLVYPWLMAQDKHVHKYTRLYTDLGMDVLWVTISPLDLLMPVPRAQVAAVKVLEFLLANPEYNKLVLHGMSVGAYGLMEVMTKMEQNEDRYMCIRPRFIGQVWDSPCDLPGLKEGVARSMTDNRAWQMRIMDALDWFLKVRYEAATRHYVKTQDMYHKNYVKAPSLFLYSRADPVSVPYINTDLANNWDAQGFEVFSKIFNESKHVSHYFKYKAEYTAHIHAFLHHIDMLKYAGINLED